MQESKPLLRMMLWDRHHLKDLYLINHMPKRKVRADGTQPTKQQAQEVRACLENCPGYREARIQAIEFNRYDVLVQLRAGSNIPHLAGCLYNWDNYKMKNLSNMSLVSHTYTTKQQRPPFMYIKYPTAISISFIIQQLETHINIVGWQPTSVLGEALLETNPPEVAERLYDCSIPCGEL